MKDTTYWPNWQKNRINFIINNYGKDFFKNKSILELGSFNGYIGEYFRLLGADVISVEGREENVNQIKIDYPQLNIIQMDLDTPEWTLPKFDIIINFGLFYHLRNYHKEHLNNCMDNSDLLFLESVVYDSFESELYIQNEKGIDQALSGSSGTPSTSYIEDILKENKNKMYIKSSSELLNGDAHKYNWIDSDSKKYININRRFWTIERRK